MTDAGDRVRAAAAAGFDAVEMWSTTDKDLDSLAKALADTGVQLTSLLAEPADDLHLPGHDLAPFHQGLDLGRRARPAARLPAHRPRLRHRASRG